MRVTKLIALLEDALEQYGDKDVIVMDAASSVSGMIYIDERTDPDFDKLLLIDEETMEALGCKEIVT